MKRLDYLRFAIQQKLYQKANWLYNAFSLTKESKQDFDSDPYEGRLVRESWGYSFLQNGEMVKIDDSKSDQPLFTMWDNFIADPTWAPNIKDKVETSVGSIITNYILLVDYFGGRIPFQAYGLDVEKVEDFIIANRGIDIPGKPRDPTKIYLDEYIKMSQGVEFIRTLPTLSTSSLTERNMTRPPGIENHKKKLLSEKYNNDLTDPVKLAQFESEMLLFTDEYRKDDPSEGVIVKGKIRNNSIRKMFSSSGAEGGMGMPMVPVIESLSEGVTYSPEQFAAFVNGARAGSYFRGLDTVKGGVSFKLAVRVLASFFVGEDDCGSKLGLKVVYDKTNINQLVQRIEVGTNKKRIENIEEASNYLGRFLVLRTPGWCRSESSMICRTCAGPRLSKFAEGLAIPASDVTGIILAASMAAMHKNTTEVTELDLHSAMMLESEK